VNIQHFCLLVIVLLTISVSSTGKDFIIYFDGGEIERHWLVFASQCCFCSFVASKVVVLPRLFFIASRDWCGKSDIHPYSFY